MRLAEKPTARRLPQRLSLLAGTVTRSKRPSSLTIPYPAVFQPSNNARDSIEHVGEIQFSLVIVAHTHSFQVSQCQDNDYTVKELDST